MNSRYLALFALVFACQEKLDHPAYLPSCQVGQHCPLSVGVGRMTGATGSPPDPGGGEAGSTGDATELRGSVVDLVDDTFDNSLPYINPAIVEGLGPDGRLVSALWNGAEPFVLDGIEAARVSWVSVRPQAGLFNLRSLHPIATNIRQTVELGLVRADVMDEIFFQFGVPQERAAGAAQIVALFTVTQAGVTRGVSGVTVFSAHADFATYKNGGTWGGDPPRTDDSGLAVLGNIPAVPFPGNPLRVTLGGSASGFVDLTVASDAVTLVEIPLSP